jgi:DNA mismatch repair protein MutS
VILDEIGRGTSTYDGLAIAWAVAEYLHAIGCKTLFATHYHYLNELANRLEGVANYRVAVKEQGDRIVWLHKVLPGGTDRSYGVHVARMAGVPPEVVQRAEQILREFERRGTQGAFSAAHQRRADRPHQKTATDPFRGGRCIPCWKPSARWTLRPSAPLKRC